MAKYVAAIDQGTTSTRFMIFDHSGKSDWCGAKRTPTNLS